MTNPFVYLQLHTQDHAKATQFYGSLFQWKLEDNPEAETLYTEVDVGEGGTRAGILAAASPDVPSYWLPFIQVHDVEEVTRRARVLGATIMKEPTAIPGKGSYSVLTDPTGATFALWEAAPSSAASNP
jgi:predicted enzyme related to lactoylglutathione lyase